MQKQILHYIALSSCLLYFFSCTEKSDPALEAKKFTSIFDNNDFNSSYTPVDIQQTVDGGYIILAERRLENTRITGIYLLKADRYGKFIRALEVGDTLVNPVGKFTKIDDKFYFFCMRSTTLVGAPTQARLASINENLDDLNIISVKITTSEAPKTIIYPTYPAVSAFTGNNFILLSYNNDSRESVVSEINLTGTGTKIKGFTIGVGEGSEDAILKHYNKMGKQFPFEVGVASPGLYYFNGFYEYTFSLVFTDLSDGEPIGKVQGQQQNGGFSAITNLGSGKFAAARFNFGDNFFLPKSTISTTGNSIGVNLGGYSLPELLPDSKVKILRITIDGKGILVYASDTQTRQIGLYFYDEATGAFLSSRYLGFSNPYQISNLIQTEDEGLAVCGTTYLAGRLPRICLFKLSKEEVTGNVKR